MKILVVCQHFYPEQFRINDICFSLALKGHDVTVLTGLPNYPRGKVFKEYKFFKKRNEIINGVKIKRSFLIGRGKTKLTMAINYLCFIIFGSLKALFIKKDFDIIYVYQISPITMTWPAILIKKIKKIPLVIHTLDQWPISITAGGVKKESLLYKILYKLSIKSYNNADIITISSKTFKKYFENELKIYEKDKGLIYNPSYAESNYANIKHINNNIFDLVFAGNIGPALSVETIVETAKVLKKEKDIYFHIVGDGLSKNKCEELAKKYKLKNIKFYGYFNVEEMSKFYSIADSFLVTMVDNEVVNSTLPAKIQSYMLAGKPILGAASGESKIVIEEANCGMCTNSLDYEGLAQIILDVKNDKKKIKIWSENSLKYYKENFDKEKCISQIENIFIDVINNKKIDK